VPADSYPHWIYRIHPPFVNAHGWTKLFDAPLVAHIYTRIYSRAFRARVIRVPDVLVDRSFSCVAERTVPIRDLLTRNARLFAAYSHLPPHTRLPPRLHHYLPAATPATTTTYHTPHTTRALHTRTAAACAALCALPPHLHTTWV